MKTSKFKAELEKMGYTFEDGHLKNEHGLMAAWISTSDVNKIDSAYACELPPKLFSLIYKYAATPIAEHEEEPKLFNIQIIKGKWEHTWLYRDCNDRLAQAPDDGNADDNQRWSIKQIEKYGIEDESVYARFLVWDD